jgi:hypothetical protein
MRHKDWWGISELPSAERKTVTITLNANIGPQLVSPCANSHRVY